MPWHVSVASEQEIRHPNIISGGYSSHTCFAKTSLCAVYSGLPMRSSGPDDDDGRPNKVYPALPQDE
jgi:hypothetical protein